MVIIISDIMRTYSILMPFYTSSYYLSKFFIISLVSTILSSSFSLAFMGCRHRAFLQSPTWLQNNNNDYIDVDATRVSTTPIKADMKNLIELAKLSQPEMNVRVPFVEPSLDSTSKSIDCIMHYRVECDDENYIIATPYDHEVAIACEEENKDIRIIDPSSPQMKELFEISSSFLEEMFGTNLVLLNTPQTLTIMGDLDLVCKNIQDGKPIDEYIHKDFVNSFSDSDIPLDPQDDDIDEDESDNAAERLFAFEHKGYVYSLIRMLEPFIIVGKEDPTSLTPRHLLLTPEESKRGIPKITELFQEEIDSLLLGNN